MPLYQYDCPACGGSVEVIENMGAPSVRACPACGGDARRIIATRATLDLRGDGFTLTPEKLILALADKHLPKERSAK